METTVSSCVQLDRSRSTILGGKTTNQKYSRSAERVCNLNKIRQVRSDAEHLSPSLLAIDEIQKDRNRGIA